MNDKQTSTWKEITDFNDEHFPGWRKTPVPGFNAGAGLIYLTNALAGEVGEICGDSKKLVGGGTNRAKPMPTVEKMISEVADMEVYKVLLCEYLGQDEAAFAVAVRKKIAVNCERMRAWATESGNLARVERGSP